MPEDRARFEPVYERALLAELNVILDAIPHDALAIQWDTAVEFGFIEASSGYDEKYGRGLTAWFDDVWDGVIERAVRQAAAVPLGVELGYHLCYGDAGEQHFVEPADTGNLATFIRLLLARTPRPIDWFHLPVPIERDDEAYFAPLKDLGLAEETELYLGLVHREDGVEGATRRIAAARRSLPVFGVGTECGIGRAPAEQVASILETHRAVAAAW